MWKAYKVWLNSVSTILGEDHSELSERFSNRTPGSRNNFLSRLQQILTHGFQAKIGMYAGDDNMAVNFYGPPASLKTFSYHQILAPEKNSIDRKKYQED